MKKLRIAQIAPYWFDIPPKGYGGSERIISSLTEELVKRGHDVTLFATEGSQTTARLVSPLPSGITKDIEFYPDTNFSTINTFVNAYVYQHAADFDIIHSHAGYFTFPFVDFVKTPTIHTLHNQLPDSREPVNEMFRKYKHQNFVSISKQFQSHFDLHYIAAVHHGIDLNDFLFDEKGGDYLFWLGRADKFKGEKEAIKAAKATKKPLLLEMSLRPDALAYFKDLKKQLSGEIKTVTNVKFVDTDKYYQKAKALLFPIQWQEPFGMIFIEAMSCGTPVIAYGRGSVPEIIKDGETGFIINPSKEEMYGNWQIKKTGLTGLCEAIEQIYAMPDVKYRMMRKAARTHVEKHFRVGNMVDKYEKVYQEVVSFRK